MSSRHHDPSSDLNRRQAIESFTDYLIASCQAKGAPICVGLDPVYERLPSVIRSTVTPAATPAQAVCAIEQYVADVLETIAPHAACVKIQSACFERYRWRGVAAYERAIDHAKKLGLIVIADAKRGDIGISAAHYAAGCLADSSSVDDPALTGPDALTINPYLGADAMEPFIESAARDGKGLFTLVRTSNPGSDALQGLRLGDGRTVGEAVAQLVAQLGADPRYLGRNGYSLLGAVVGATKAGDVAMLRSLMPQQIFLVPGFGAQGGTVDDLKPFFKPDGTGALITASRSIIYAYEKTDTDDWRAAVEEATVAMRHQVITLLKQL